MAKPLPSWVWIAAGIGAVVLVGGGITTAVVLWVLPDKGKPWASLFTAAEQQNGLPPGLLGRVAEEESDYDPNAVSPVGAQGMMQFMPATAKDVGLSNPFDPTQAIPAAGRYLAALFNQLVANLGSATWSMALAAYNAGPGNVIQAVQDAQDADDADNWLAYLPTSAANQAQTQGYVGDIAGDLGLAGLGRPRKVRQPVKRRGAKLAGYVGAICQDLALA